MREFVWEIWVQMDDVGKSSTRHSCSPLCMATYVQASRLDFLLGRPAWSDRTGRIELKKGDFIPPPGWEWENKDDKEPWKTKPELSIDFEPDEGHDTWRHEVFEHQTRQIFQSWPTLMEKSVWFDPVRTCM